MFGMSVVLWITIWIAVLVYISNYNIFVSINPDICLATADCCDLNDYNTDKRFTDGDISRKLLPHAPAQWIHRGAISGSDSHLGN